MQGGLGAKTFRFLGFSVAVLGVVYVIAFLFLLYTGGFRYDPTPSLLAGTILTLVGVGIWLLFRNSNRTIRTGVVVGFLAVLAAISGSFVYAYTPTDYLHIRAPNQEKVVINQVAFDGADPNTLLVDVKSLWNQKTVFDSAIIKDSEGATVYEHLQVVPDELPANAQMTLAIHLSNNMTSGKYTIMLVTTMGSVFVSPSSSFTVP